MKRLRSRRAALVASLAAALVAASVLVANGATARTASPTRSSSTTRSRSRPPTRGGRSIPPHPWSTTRSTTRSSRTRAATSRIRFRCSCRRSRRARTRRRTPSSSSGTSTSPTGRRSPRPTSPARCGGSSEPEGQPGLPARRHHGLGAVEVHGRHALEDAGHPAAGDPREPVDRRPQLGAGEEERRHRRRQRGQGRQGRELAQLHRVGRRRQRPVHARAPTARPRRSRSTPNAKYWGAKKSRWSSVVVRNMVAATQLLNVGRGSHEIAVDLSADQARDADGQQERQGLAPALDLDLLRLRQRRPEGLGGHVEQELPEGDPLRARLRLDREPRRQGRDPGARRHPVDVPRLAAAERTGQDGRREGQGGAGGVGGRRPEGDDDLPERPDDQRRPVHLDGAEGPGEPEGRRASTSRSRARRPRTGSTTTGPGSRRSASRSGAPTTPIPPTTSSSRPASSSAFAPAGRRAATRRSRSSPPRRW